MAGLSPGPPDSAGARRHHPAQNSSFIQEKELRPLLRRADAGELKLYWLLVSDCRLADQLAATYHCANGSQQALNAMSEAQVNTVLNNLARDLEKHALQAKTARQAAARAEEAHRSKEAAAQEASAREAARAAEVRRAREAAEEKQRAERLAAQEARRALEAAEEKQRAERETAKEKQRIEQEVAEEKQRAKREAELRAQEEPSQKDLAPRGDRPPRLPRSQLVSDNKAGNWMKASAGPK